MTRTQVHAGLALLRKVLPDLASVEVSGNPDRPLSIQLVRFSDGVTIDMPANPLQLAVAKHDGIPNENVDSADTIIDNNDLAEGAPVSGPQRDQKA